MGPDAVIFVFWMLNFKPTFSLSSYTFIKRLFSSSSLSTIRVVSSAYLRLLIFLLAILIPACVSSSPAFLMMYSAYKLNKHGDNIQPWLTPFPVWNQSVVSCPVLTIPSWPAYRFLKRRKAECKVPGWCPAASRPSQREGCQGVIRPEPEAQGHCQQSTGLRRVRGDGMKTQLNQEQPWPGCGSQGESARSWEQQPTSGHRLTALGPHCPPAKSEAVLLKR